MNITTNLRIQQNPNLFIVSAHNLNHSEFMVIKATEK